MKLKHLFFTAALPLIVSCGGKGKEVRDDSACGSASDTVLPVNIEIEDTPAAAAGSSACPLRDITAVFLTPHSQASFLANWLSVLFADPSTPSLQW